MRKNIPCAVLVAVAVAACAQPRHPRPPVIPAMEFSRAANRVAPGELIPYNATTSAAALRNAPAFDNAGARAGEISKAFESPAFNHAIPVASSEGARASVRFAGGEEPLGDIAPGGYAHESIPQPGVFHHSGSRPEPRPESEIYSYRSQAPNIRDYTGPLSYGDPGVSASLWRESRGDNNLFRDHRAYQPMDLVTILVSEDSEGEKTAETETKSKSTVEASIEALLGLPETWNKSNPQASLNPAIKADSINNFKGEGSTERTGKLKAKISAMVVEVLPSGIIRIEGEKIISVNSEEQTMVISGLVRPYDLNASNEVDSSKIANLRIDYYGDGIVGESQVGGWLGRLMRVVWPF